LHTTLKTIDKYTKERVEIEIISKNSMSMAGNDAMDFF